jgi:hypothetical protein
MNDPSCGVRLLAFALLLHESVYLADWGFAYIQRSFAPVLGLRLTALGRTALHLVHAGVCIASIVVPTTETIYGMIITLTLVIAAFPVRLSNHLIVAWFLMAGLAVKATPSYMVVIIAMVYFFAGFAKLNRTFLTSADSCGLYFARLLITIWGVGDFRDVRVVRLSSTWGIAVAELLVAALLVDARTRYAGFLIVLLLATLFGLLCHVHFSAVVIAALAAAVNPEALTPEPAWAIAAVIGGAIGFKLGNWRWYAHQRVAATNHICFGALIATSWLVAFHHPHGKLIVATTEHLRLAAVVLLAAFAANCLSPYLGLKTAFSMTMFSNMRPDRWDHLIVHRPLRRFRVNYITFDRPIAGLPMLAQFSRDAQLRRALSELHLTRSHKYSPLFVRETLRLLKQEGCFLPESADGVVGIDSGASGGVDRALFFFPHVLPQATSAVFD